jgi:hypothetical protein
MDDKATIVGSSPKRKICVIHLSREETHVILSIKNFLCFRREEEEKSFVNFTVSVSVSVRMKKKWGKDKQNFHVLLFVIFLEFIQTLKFSLKRSISD